MGVSDRGVGSFAKTKDPVTHFAEAAITGSYSTQTPQEVLTNTKEFAAFVEFTRNGSAASNQARVKLQWGYDKDNPTVVFDGMARSGSDVSVDELDLPTVAGAAKQYWVLPLTNPGGAYSFRLAIKEVGDAANPPTVKIVLSGSS